MKAISLTDFLLFVNTTTSCGSHGYYQRTKFFKFMGETGRLDDETVIGVLDALRLHRNDFLEAVEDDDSGDWW
jgi:hypothetical protein